MRELKILTGLIFLLMGFYLYLKFRSESLLIFKWAENLGLDFFVRFIRSSYGGFSLKKMEYTIFSIPYGLWVISFCCFNGAIWHNDRSLSAIIWRLIVPIIAITSELLQLVGLLPGTYDINDLFILFIATIIGLTISNL